MRDPRMEELDQLVGKGQAYTEIVQMLAQRAKSGGDDLPTLRAFNELGDQITQRHIASSARVRELSSGLIADCAIAQAAA